MIIFNKVRIMNKKRYIQPITELLHTILEQPFLAGSTKTQHWVNNGDGTWTLYDGDGNPLETTEEDPYGGADSKGNAWSAWDDLEDY